MRVGVFCLLVLIHSQLSASTDFDRDQMQQRISPVGNVHVEKSANTAAATAQPAAAQPAEKQSPGQATYEHYCIVCHRDGVAGAPKFRDAGDWSPRLAKQNIDAMVAIDMKGFNAMPAKGTCQECTEADIKAAIEYMVPKK